MADGLETFDTLFNTLVSRLEAFATTEAGIDAARNFIVRPDNYRALGELEKNAHVLVYGDSLQFNEGDSAYANLYPYEYSVRTECIAMVPREVKDGSPDLESDRKSGARLRYLIAQVLRALYQPDDWYLGFDPGIIGKRPPPRVEFITPNNQQGQRPITGAVITHRFEMAWEPTPLTGTVLSEIYVDADRWTGLYTI